MNSTSPTRTVEPEYIPLENFNDREPEMINSPGVLVYVVVAPRTVPVKEPDSANLAYCPGDAY
jgi:hypothetical protein